jgi:hypothetical protein
MSTKIFLLIGAVQHQIKQYFCYIAMWTFSKTIPKDHEE